MRVSKIRYVTTPTRSNITDAGIDFYVPEFDDEFKKDIKVCNNDYVNFFKNQISLESGHKILIPSGIKVDVPTGYALIAFNKSGISSKFGVDVLACVVDSGYQGEVHLSIINLSNRNFIIKPGMKLIQFVEIQVSNDPIQLVSLTELYKKESTRGEGGFGSTGDINE